MKNFLFATLLLLSVFSFAQNGGQYSQNNSVKIAFAGMISGDYYVKITNRTNYLGTYRYEYNGQIKLFSLARYDDTLMKVGKSINGVVKVKTLTPTGPHIDNGWVELCLSVTPLRFVESKAEYMENTNEILVSFSVADVVNIDRISVEVSIDGGHNYQEIAIVWPEPVSFNPYQKYVVKLDANRIKLIKSPSKN